MLTGMIAGIFSVVPSVDGAEYLTEVVIHKDQLQIGALLQLSLVPIYIGFSLVLYPILKQFKENLAIGFVGFRLMAGVFQFVGVILLPLFLFLSSAFTDSATLDTALFEALGALLKIGRDLANHLGVMLATGFGNLLLYFIFYRTRLIPRWLSWWGVIGNVVAIFASILILLDLIEVISISFAIMTIPLVMEEVVLAIWLITKGFDEKMM